MREDLTAIWEPYVQPLLRGITGICAPSGSTWSSTPAGDVVYDLEPGEQLLDDLHSWDVDCHIASMECLAALDVDTVDPGHGENFDGAPLRELADGYIRSRTR